MFSSSDGPKTTHIHFNWTRYISLASNQSSRPVVLTVALKQQDLDDYKLAVNTLACYCKIYNYKLYQIIMEDEPELSRICPQKDIMFQRHCVTIHLLRSNPEIPYLLFMDADMGVVNPNHFIESYIDPEYDLLFYERIESSEITAGTYIIKNTPYALNFLQAWVDYENKLPNSYNGRDNGALHQVFLEQFRPDDPRLKICRDIWEKAKDWLDRYNYIVCARYLLNSLTFDRIKIISKRSRKAWARDAWLLEGMWSPNDFIMHEWKLKHLGKIGYEGWRNPFSSAANFDLESCTLSVDPLKNWQYDERLAKSDAFVTTELEKRFRDVEEAYEEKLKFIKNSYNLTF